MKIVIRSICVVGLIFLALVIGRSCAPTTDSSEEIDTLKGKIEQLNKEKEVIQRDLDSLVLEVNKIDTVIDLQIKWHEKNITDILSNSVSDDALFFREYLSKDSLNRLISGNNY